MSRSPARCRLAAFLVVAGSMAGWAALPLAASAQPAPARAEAGGSAAMQACERAGRQALAGKGVRPAEVSFENAPALQANLSNDSQVVLRGVARWRSGGEVRSINYSCTVDLPGHEVVGLVMRDSTPPPADAAAARPPAEPDLSELSPAACESGAAETLKRHWPRVAQISFDTTTRRLRQTSASHAELHGSGRATPTPDAPATFFAFDCEIDPRDGRVLRTRVSW